MTAPLALHQKLPKEYSDEDRGKYHIYVNTVHHFLHIFRGAKRTKTIGLKSNYNVLIKGTIPQLSHIVANNEERLRI